MATGGMVEILLLLILSTAPGGDLPHDVLGLLDPAAGLETLSEKTTEVNLRRLISARAPDTAPGADGKLSRELESAIQNLASSSEKVRSSSRKKLVNAGAGVRSRLEEVAKNDARRAEEAKKVLQALADSESSGAHEKNIRQTLAIRLAGQKKMKGLVEEIRASLKSENAFVRYAAKDALLKLGEKPGGSTTVGADATLKARALRAAPKTTTAVAAIQLTTSKAGTPPGLTIASFFEGIAKSLPAGAAGPDFEAEKKKAREGLLEFVTSYGNMHPERAYLVNVGAINERGGGLGIIVQGLYEPGVLRATLNKNSTFWKTTEVEGVTVYNSLVMRLVLLSDREVLMLPVIASNHFPLPAYLKNFRAGTDAFGQSERLAQFARTLEKPFQVRALALTGEKLMGTLWAELENGGPPGLLDAIKGMSEVELVVQPSEDGKKSNARVEASFDKNENAKTLTGFVDGGVKEGIREMEQMLQQIDVPMLRTVLDFLKSVKVSAEAKRGIFRAELPRSSMQTVFGVFGARTTELR